MYKIVYTKTAAKDIPKLKAAHLADKAKALIDIIRDDRLVYQVYEEEKTIKILSLWTHYER